MFCITSFIREKGISTPSLKEKKSAVELTVANDYDIFARPHFAEGVNCDELEVFTIIGKHLLLPL